MQRKAPRTLNFTKAGIEKLAAPETGRQYHYDEKTPGLAICITSADTRTFYVVRRVGRDVEKMKIGRWPDWTVEQARDEAARINGKVADGVNPAEQRRQARKSLTLKEAFEHFLLQPTRTRSKRPKAERTKHEYRLQLNAYLKGWHDRRLTQISKADVEKLHNELAEANGHYCANRTLALLKAIYNEAADAGYGGINPAAHVRKFEERSRERFLLASELPKFWEALEAEPSEMIRDAIKMLLWTGQRKMNVLSMRWADVSIADASWTIPTTKTGRHSVPLPSPALEILKRRSAMTGEGEYVFPRRRGKGHLVDVMKQWRALLERAEIFDLRLHDLRRSLGSWQVKTGASLAIVGKTLGHRQPQTTMIYGRVDADPVLLSMETATAAILAAAKPKPAKKLKLGVSKSQAKHAQK